MYKLVSGGSIYCADMSLHRCLYEQAVLVTAVIVVVNVVLNGQDQLLTACERVSIVALSFENTPEAFHRAIVNAATNTRHTLRHPCIQQLLVEDSAGILVPTVTVEQRMCIWIFPNCLVKGFKDQFVVISVAENIADDPAVTQIKDCTQIELVDDRSFVPLELRYIRQPLFVRSTCPEFTAQDVWYSNLWVRCSFCATMFFELYGRLNMQHPTQMQNTLVAGRDAVILFQIIPNPAMPLIRMFCINLLNCRRNLLVFKLMLTFRMFQPLVIG